jgi:hypothetical protein
MHKDDSPTRGFLQEQATCKVHVLVSEAMKGTDTHQQLAAKYGQNWLTQSVYEWIEIFKSS